MKTRPSGRVKAFTAAATLVIPTGVAVPASAQQTTPLDPVVTIGTRSPDRTVSQSPVPVDVLSLDLLARTGLPETWQRLQRLVPSANVPHVPIGDNHMRPVTLRGLAPHHVLVLVNGRRRHPAAALLAGPSIPFTAFTDMGAIPTGVIERIEVLRDGAAAQYGSDAIGGVVNLVTRTGAHRDLRIQTGRSWSSEGGRAFADGRSIGASGSFGVASADGAHFTLGADLRDRDGTNRAYPDRRPQYFAGDPRNDAPPRVSSHLGNGSVREATTFLSAGVPLGAGAEAYLFGGIARRRGTSPDAFFRRPLDPRTVRAIHPDGFLPVIGSRIDDASALAGLRGTTAGWRWDASSGWGGNRVSYSVHGSNNASLGAESPTTFDAGKVATWQWTSNVDVGRELRVGTVPIDVAGGAELRIEGYRITAGEPDSWRDGGARILDGPAAGQPAAVGAQGMVGYRPLDEVNARRTSSALHLEVESRPLPRLLLQSAVRAERYDDFGSTTNGKLAARLGPMRGLALRGSIGSGFRAPALAQQHFSSTRTVYHPVAGVNTVLTVRTFPVGTPEARVMGAKPLRPERALNIGAGVVLERPRLPLVTADLYEIRIDDRIDLPGTITDTSLVRLFAENGMRGIGGGNYFANVSDVRTRGMDVVASHAFPLGGAGVVRVIGGYNQTRTEVIRVLPPPPQIAAFGSAGFDRTLRGVLENGQPRETITLSLHYGVGPWALGVHGQRSGPTAQLDRADPAADQRLRPRWITDARVSYEPGPRVQLSVSATNLFDRYPDEWRDFRDGLQATGASMQGIFRHPGALSPFGMNGRTVYVELAFR